MKKIVVLIVVFLFGINSCQTIKEDELEYSSRIVIEKFMKSPEFQTLVLDNPMVKSIGRVDDEEAFVEFFSCNNACYPVIEMPIANNGKTKGSIVAIHLPDQARKPVTGHNYLVVLRDLSSFDANAKTGLVFDYDLNFDSYLAGVLTIENNLIISLDFYEMPDAIANRYSFKKTYFDDSKIICDADNNQDVSFGECYKCFKDAIRSQGTLEFVCDAADIFVFSCSGSVAISCAIISTNY